MDQLELVLDDVKDRMAAGPEYRAVDLLCKRQSGGLHPDLDHIVFFNTFAVIERENDKDVGVFS
jgi:hypothetical protein